MRRIAALALTVLLLASGCRKQEGLKRFEAEFLTLFDTVTQIIGRAESKEAFTAFAEFIHDELETYHQLYDIYNSYDGVNNIKTVNDSAGKAPVKVDPKIIGMLLEARDMYGRTGGKMNVALGPVLKLWHDARETAVDDPDAAKLPGADALREAARHTDLSDVIIDETASTVFLPEESMRLDVGSIGKGYAVDRVYRTALDKGWRNFVLSVGGNVMAHGSRDETGAPWSISLQNPNTDSEQEFLFSVRLSGMALVTSGNYQRYFMLDDKRYHHLIDPHTLYPADYFAAVSVLSPDSGLADCLSTALYCLPEEEGRALLKNFPGAMAVYVYEDGTIAYAGGFEDYIKKDS